MVERAKLKTNNEVRRSSRSCRRLCAKEPKEERSVDETDRYPAQLEAVMESVEEGVVICDAAGRVVRMNRRALEIHEYASVERAWGAPSEFADTFELRTVEGLSIPRADWPLSRAVRGETFRDCEVRLYNKRTGREWIGRCGGTPVRDEQGKVVLTTLTLRELRKPEDGTVEERVRQTEQKFRTIFDNTSDGIFLLDLETRRFAMCNRSCLQMLGYTLEEFMSLGIPDLHLDEDLPFIQAQIEEFLNGGRPIRRDIRFKRKDGGIVLADLSPDLIWLDGKRYVVVALKDVTVRKRAQEALQKERDQVRDYLRVAGVMMVALDAEGRITLINEKGCEILGYRPEEIVGRDWFEVCLSPEIREEVRGVFNRLMAGDVAPVEYYENVVLRKDGEQRVIAFHNTVLRDPSSGIIGILFSGEDITERRRAEEALTASEGKYRSLVQNIPDVTWTTDRQGRTLFVSPNVKDVYGYSVDEICAGGDTWLGNVHPDDRPWIEKAFGELFTRNKPYDVEYRIRRKDGNWIWLHDRSVSSYEKDGQWYADGVFSDITERKRMEEELRRHTEHLEELVAARTAELHESETRYRSLYHTIADGVFVMGADGRIDDVNDSACAQLGYTREELIGMPVSAISARPDFNLADIFERLRTAGSLSYETSHRRKDGTDVLVELSVALSEYRGQPAILGVARDITGRKQVEQALQFTQFAVDHTADAAFWMTEDARFFYVNEAACQALGYSRDELLNLTVYDIDPAFTESRWRDSWRRLKANKSIVFDTVHRAGDGRIYPVEIRANYVEFGGRAYDCAFARDITDRQRADKALRESEERHRFLIESLNDWIWEVDRGGVYRYASPQCREMLGYEPEEIVGKTPFDLMPPDEAERVRGIFAAIAGQARPFRRLENVNRHKDGRLVVLETNGVPVLDVHGKLAGYRGIDRDITERKRADRALRESEERYRLLLDRGFDGIFVHEDFRIVQLNDRFAEMTGYARAELLGSTAIDLFTPDSQERIRQYIRSGAGGYFDIELQRRDGRILQVESFGAPCQFQGRNARIVGLRDVTERKLAAEALRRLNERLEQQVAQRTEDLTHTITRLQQLTLELSQAEDRERKRIADLLHDDVQQTLAAARFHLDLLGIENRGAGESGEIVRQVRQMLRDAIEKARNLSHELSPALYQIDLTETLNWLAHHMQQRHGLTVHVDARGQIDTPSEPLKAFLYKVAQELLFNVVKHAATSEATLGLRRVGRCVCLSVLDRGRGFDPQELEGAAGVGLPGIRERVQLLGGRMKIKSMRGRGSRFVIVVPDEIPREEAAQGEYKDE